ncbi:multidrug ABC transporter permease/ATP-binding protein [Vibrio cyclitrophicus]|uniref:Multidrug ABC transporter permease/ATP-binding protein n=1 Tax=Vibrio cyclitrophicus ZF270 TaxID=1136176 RepID=A0AAN0LIY9_9VIBR|nr:multidrug ABC transporter permease/ATP-binding protein [Vibrio cyclitrophicus]ERM60912.1 putative ATP-binding component of a transport system [Vibrio cyclitrophicus FF75]OED70030.1 multidrug ABC transporter permease/ATP-binding protein [Vibrio cyclitrophicus ZF99]OEE06407.1 multidrug ABC transporter permease/ATP-binding protein [Vibrio cyclitrophicus ZF270]OEE48241.1 multidrug ABC transporter permease/ATP-binding protein [Vibrio cyclitrophicus FF75]PME68039.1 multidrug ABC transporter perme
MGLILLLAEKQKKSLCLVILLSIASAFLSVAVIAFIQHKLLENSGVLSDTLIQFSLLLIGLLVTATVAQVALHKLGHQFVYNKRCELVSQLLNTDIEQVEKVGSAGVLASLNTDIRNITIAFVHLPELIYGLVLTFVALAYLAFLSMPLFGISVLMLSLTGVIGYMLVTRITKHVKQVREYDDNLYHDYQSLIDGRKELSLNPFRAKRYFDETFSINAEGYRKEVTQADILNGFAANMANTVVLALIGLNFYLAIGLGWATVEVASTFALVVLFMRTPLMSAVGSIPTLITANISMRKLSSLDLSPNRTLNPKSAQTKVFKSLSLVEASYRYRSDSDGDSFGVGPINFKIERGEHIFVIGGNGSGKSTFARLLTGLYRPHAGQVYVDGNEVTQQHWQDYRQQFSAVFSDFHLFHQIVDGEGQDIDSKDIDEWMVRLEMAHKVDHKQGTLSDVRYSQGQRKRLALMMSVLEKRGCILLDEWAADQDPRFRKLFYRQLLPLLKERGVTVIAITHDDAYFDAADRIFKMDSGNLIELSKGNLAQAHQALESVVA